MNCIALDRYRVATAVVRMQPRRGARGGSGGSARARAAAWNFLGGKATLTKPSVIRVGQQFQAEVPAWHGPVPLDGSAPMMPEEIDLVALPEKEDAPGNEVAVYGVPAPRSKRVDACLLYTSPSPRDQRGSRMPSSA